MAISIPLSANGGTTSTTSFSITIPTGVEANDILLLQFTHRGTGNGTFGGTGGDGFTLKLSGTYNTSFSAKVYWKRADGTEDGEVISVTGLTDSCAASLLVHRGVHRTGDPFDVGPTFEANASGNESHASVTTVTADSSVCLVVANSPDLSISSPSAANVGALTIRTQVLSTGGTDTSIAHSSIPWASTGATGTFTWSQTNAASGSFAYALKPYVPLAYTLALDAGSVSITDPLANVSLLLGNDNAADGTTTFIDQSTGAHSVSIGAGTVEYDSAQAPSGMSTSIAFNGTGGLHVNTHADFGFGTGDFTVEFMLRRTNTGVCALYYSEVVEGDGGLATWLNDGVIGWDNAWTTPNQIFDESAAGAVASATWVHAAYARKSGVMRFYVSGAQVGSTLAFTNDLGSTRVVDLGNNYRAEELLGWLSNVRVTKGVARYTGSSFTPPTLPLASATELLADRTVSLAAGSVAIAGTAATLRHLIDKELVLDAGAVTVAGTAASLERGYALDLAPGAVSVAGTAAALERAALLALGGGAVVIAGTAASLTRGRTLDVEAGSVSIAGTASALHRAALLSLSAGGISVAGTDAAFDVGKKLSMDAGDIAIDGTAATLSWSGETGSFRQSMMMMGVGV